MRGNVNQRVLAAGGGGAGVRRSLLAATAASAAAAPATAAPATAAEVPHLETAREWVLGPGSGSARAASGEAALAGRSAGTRGSETGQRRNWLPLLGTGFEGLCGLGPRSLLMLWRARRNYRGRWRRLVEVAVYQREGHSRVGGSGAMYLAPVCGCLYTLNV